MTGHPLPLIRMSDDRRDFDVTCVDPFVFADLDVVVFDSAFFEAGEGCFEAFAGGVEAVREPAWPVVEAGVTVFVDVHSVVVEVDDVGDADFTCVFVLLDFVLLDGGEVEVVFEFDVVAAEDVLQVVECVEHFCVSVCGGCW